jgi:hypothetical protein
MIGVLLGLLLTVAVVDTALIWQTWSATAKQVEDTNRRLEAVEKELKSHGAKVEGINRQLEDVDKELKSQKTNAGAKPGPPTQVYKGKVSLMGKESLEVMYPGAFIVAPSLSLAAVNKTGGTLEDQSGWKIVDRKADRFKIENVSNGWIEVEWRAEGGLALKDGP